MVYRIMCGQSIRVDEGENVTVDVEGVERNQIGSQCSVNSMISVAALFVPISCNWRADCECH